MAPQLPAPASTPTPLRRFGRLQPPTRRIRLDSDLLSLSTHPSEPLLAVGESSGRVSIWGWPIDSGGSGHHSNNIGDIWGRPTLEDEHWWQKKWSTKRHKGSTRCVRFSSDGDVLFSTGTDSLLKAASTTTGRIISKSWLPGTTGMGRTPTELGAPATALLILNPQHILLGNDAAEIHLFDLRVSTTLPNLTSAVVSTWIPEAPIDYISSLTALPAGDKSTTGYSYHFLATAGEYLFHMDSRRPGKILHASEDQEDELLCSVVVPEWTGSNPRNQNDTDAVESGKIITGLASGVLGIWNRGEYEGHYERINVSKAAAIVNKKPKRQKTKATSALVGGGESVDCISLLPNDFRPLINNLDPVQQKRQEGFYGRHVAVGTGDGHIKIVRTGGNPAVLSVYEHFPMSKKQQERDAQRKELKSAGIKEHDSDYEEEESREAVLGVEVTVEGRIVSGGGNFVTMFFESNEETEGNDDERGRSDESMGMGTGGDNDSDGEDGWNSDSSDDRKKRKREKPKRRKKAKGDRVSKPNVVGSFAGLD